MTEYEKIPRYSNRFLMLKQARKRKEPEDKISGLKKDIVYYGIEFLYKYTVSGYRVYEKDIPYLKKVMISNTFEDQEVQKKVKELLVDKMDAEGFMEYVLEVKHKLTDGIYAKYFFYNITKKDGKVYSSLLNMYWNDSLKVWERKDKDGFYNFSIFMPYNKMSVG